MIKLLIAVLLLFSAKSDIHAQTEPAPVKFTAKAYTSVDMKTAEFYGESTTFMQDSLIYIVLGTAGDVLELNVDELTIRFFALDENEEEVQIDQEVYTCEPDWVVYMIKEIFKPGTYIIRFYIHNGNQLLAETPQIKVIRSDGEIKP